MNTPFTINSHQVHLGSRGLRYSIHLLDEAGIDTDPTLTIFRGLEEEPIVTVHLNPTAPCTEASHVIVRPPEWPPE